MRASKITPFAVTKKQQILSAYGRGVRDLMEIATEVQCRPSYVAQVLQGAGYIQGYFDLYTTTSHMQNVYSPFFRNVLSFRDLQAANESVNRIDSLYKHFEELRDRAGQHHAMLLALIGQNRARWSGKLAESDVFHRWLVEH